MVSDVALRSFAQAYRWVIAGISAALLGTLRGLPAFEWPATGYKIGIFVFVLGFSFVIEYFIQITLDPDIEEANFHYSAGETFNTTRGFCSSMSRSAGP